MKAIIFKGKTLNGKQIKSQECISFKNKIYLADNENYSEVIKESVSAQIVGKD